MAKNTGMGLLLAGGAALVLMSGGGKKKKKKSPSDTPKTNGKDSEEKPSILPKPYLEYSGGSAEKLVFDSECKEILEKIDMTPGGAHDQWLTGRYMQLVDSGMTSPEEITIQLLREQSDHCPWDDQTQWTELMNNTYTTLLDAGIRPYMKATGQLPSDA